MPRMVIAVRSFCVRMSRQKIAGDAAHQPAQQADHDAEFEKMPEHLSVAVTEGFERADHGALLFAPTGHENVEHQGGDREKDRR